MKSYLNEMHAALVRGGGEARHVADHPAAQRHERRLHALVCQCGAETGMGACCWCQAVMLVWCCRLADAVILWML
jgi:hypothetical protein